MIAEEDITYTNCEDDEPHPEHDLNDDGSTVCIGRQYPRWKPEKEED